MEAEKGWNPINEDYSDKEALLAAEPRPHGPVIDRFRKLMTSQNFRYPIWARAKNAIAFVTTFGLNFGESPEEVGISKNDPECWAEVPVMDFQAAVVHMTYAFLSGYLFPKVSNFDHTK